MALFDHTLEEIQGQKYRLVYVDAFGCKQFVDIPKHSRWSIRIGGTASSGPVSKFVGEAIFIRGHRAKVKINDTEVLTGFIRYGEIIVVGDIVHVFEHLTIGQLELYKPSWLVTREQPIAINLHSINVDYLGSDQELMARIYIDPYTGIVRDWEYNELFEATRW